MERNARLILVSVFLVLTLIGLAVFYGWIMGPDGESMSDERLIQFDGSVSGLSIGSDVRYLGVRVGRVLSIDLSASHPGRVDVSIGTDQALPASATLVALLEPQGITGLSLVELRDRSGEDVVFEVPDGAIPGYPSLVTRLSAAAEEISASIDSTLKKADRLLNDRALADLDATIREVRRLSENLAGATDNLDEIMAGIGRVAAELEQALPEYRRVATQLNREVLPTIAEAGRSVKTVSDTVAAGLGDNGEQISELIDKDLRTLVGMSDDLAAALQEFNELLNNVNEEPGALLYGERVEEVEIRLD
jgi:phospholipid/cholesterol/gamma-HCH transport system substrate-binding protein